MAQSSLVTVLGICGSLRQVCVSLDMRPINKHEVMIPAARARFDASGALTGKATRGLIAALIVALRDWTLKLKD
jgi:chromate reductase, NAD(P)H dehydrogenase (quinone)